jgi:hypothetical protein
MTTYYVGPGGNDANNGQSWANRKATLNGAEDVPVAAGDTVYVGPGVYRELLTVDVSGTSGNLISYIADVTGANTDGVGGEVRITGSDDDQTAARANAITATSKDYRKFRGFLLDTTSSNVISLATSCSGWIIENCRLQGNAASNLINVAGTGTNNTIRKCVLLLARNRGVLFTHATTVDNAGHVIENCILLAGPVGAGVRTDRIGGITVRNCLFVSWNQAVQVGTALTAGQTVTVNNCVVCGNTTGFSATVTGEIVENYNSLFSNSTDRANTSTGANSNAYPPLFALPLLFDGIRMPQNLFEFSEWSKLRAIAGTGEATDDLLGRTRPSTSAKKSWGPTQYDDVSRNTGTVHAGSAALKLADAGRVQFYVPVGNESTTFSVYVYREASYAGTSPQMVIHQPGQADVVVTDAGSSGSWNLLTTTLTPATNPAYAVVELVSNNTATSGSGSYAVYFDDLSVT